MGWEKGSQGHFESRYEDNLRFYAKYEGVPSGGLAWEGEVMKLAFSPLWRTDWALGQLGVRGSQWR